MSCKLTLDIAPLLDDQWTGIPVFTRRLAQCLLMDERVDVDFCCRLTRIPNARVMNAIRLGTGTYLRDDLQRTESSGYECIDRGRPLLFSSVKNGCSIGGREASTLHDLSTLVMPEVHEEANVLHHLGQFRSELATDEVIFCTSEATRAALTLYYPSATNKARVLYQYVDWPPSFEAMERNLPPLRLGRYAAVVGTVEPRKNLGLLIRALQLPEVKRTGMRFVVIGRQGWKAEHALSGLRAELREQLLFSGYISEFTKYRLLRHAEFLICPSVYEGFGIPALEAMSLGKPVLASMTSSLPEVIGDGGVYFDPLSVGEFVDALLEISKRRQCAALGRRAAANARAFDRARMAASVIEWASA